MAYATMIFGARGRYVQGPGAIEELGDHLLALGKNILVVGGKTGLEATRAGRTRSMERCGLSQTEALFGGETSDKEIGRLAALCAGLGCDVIMASGGGKAIDAVKAAAEDLSLPAVIVPTIASNDAPCSALTVVYNEDGTFSRLRPLKKSPALVLVDTQIIADAPVRQLVAGMGDALATWFEADACRQSGALNNFGWHISPSALALARLCLDTLLECGVEAKWSCEAIRSHPHWSGSSKRLRLKRLGFECGGVAAAHALRVSFSVIER